jgi:general secretion pathway protein L
MFSSSTSVLDVMRQRFPSVAKQFGSWWLAEFLACFPIQSWKWLKRLRRSRTSIAISAEGVAIVSGQDRTLIASETYDLPIDRNALAAALGRVGWFPAPLPVLRLPESLFLVRNVRVPVQLRGQISSVMLADLEARTPFARTEILTANVVQGRDGHAITVRQYVLKRTLLTRELERLGLTTQRIGWIEPHQPSAPESAPVRMDLQDETHGVLPLGLSLTKLWGLVAILMVASVVMSLYWQHERIAALEAEQKALRPRANLVQQIVQRQTSDAAARQTLLEKRHVQADSRDLLEEVTRMLPDSAWLMELRITESEIVISGYAQAAASLIPQLSRSHLFENARLAAPIVIDQTQGRERFSITLSRRTGLTVSEITRSLQ